MFLKPTLNLWTPSLIVVIHCNYDDLFQSKKSELDKALADVSTGDEPSIDEAIDASTPLVSLLFS